MKEIFKQVVDNSLYDNIVPKCNGVHGIYNMVPQESLHTFRNGVHETHISTAINVMGVKSENTVCNNGFDIWPAISQDLSPYEKAVGSLGMVRSGITGGTKMSGTERYTNLLPLIFTMKITTGQELFIWFCKKAITFRNYICSNNIFVLWDMMSLKQSLVWNKK